MNTHIIKSAGHKDSSHDPKPLISREGSLTKRTTATLITSLLLTATCLATVAEDFQGLFGGAPPEAQKFAVVFDFDKDSCYPAAAMSRSGEFNGGLKPTGSITGKCRSVQQLKYASTYHRSTTIQKGSNTYTAHMYALYFEKDQTTPGIGIESHRHDWEYALVWTTNGQLTHASTTAHGKVTTRSKQNLPFENRTGHNVKIVYHKDNIRTHAFRFAKKNEQAENALGTFVTPTLVNWAQMRGDRISNEMVRLLFDNKDWGAANCPFKDSKFAKEISKNPPEGYPTATEWLSASLAPPAPRNYSVEPARPEGLITRWHVFPKRNSGRDNRQGNLERHENARLVVHLPQAIRDGFRFNLKQDRRNASDRGRTPRVGQGYLAEGSSHDWPGFAKRIYLGDRRDSDAPAYQYAPNGFFVDLVRE